MIVLVDGKEIECNNDVKVIHEDPMSPDRELHITLTHEGMIADVIDADYDVSIITTSLELLDIHEMCH